MTTVKKPEPARARFPPPREAAFDSRLKDQNGHVTSLQQARGDVVVMIPTRAISSTGAVAPRRIPFEELDATSLANDIRVLRNERWTRSRALR